MSLDRSIVSYYGGADPGGTGALAIVRNDGALVRLDDMPMIDGRVVAGALNQWAMVDVEAWGIELVGSRPGEGRTSAFNFGARWGILHGTLGARHAVADVRPADWKKAYSIGGALDKQKAKARRLCSERWPEWHESFALAKHDGRAEAALIALYMANRWPDLKGDD